MCTDWKLAKAKKNTLDGDPGIYIDYIYTSSPDPSGYEHRSRSSGDGDGCDWNIPFREIKDAKYEICCIFQVGFKKKHTWQKQNFGPAESVVVVPKFYNTPPARQIVTWQRSDLIILPLRRFQNLKWNPISWCFKTLGFWLVKRVPRVFPRGL